MKWNFPYKKFPHPASKNGFTVAAVVPVHIALTGKLAIRSKRIEAIVDSGATQCVFHAAIGKAVGFDVKNGQEIDTLGIAGPAKIYVHDVAIYIPGGVIETRAAFSYDLPVAGLLGMDGFFEHFRVTFDPTAQVCEIERRYQA